MFNPSREQVRDMFFDTWRKYRVGEPLAGIATLVLQVILAHPEYHAMLEAPARYREQDYEGRPNPFLHMSLHLALEEQLSIDQPPGIVERWQRLLERHGDRHEALHHALECLAQTVWRSQQEGAPPDATAYLDCLVKRALP